MGSALSVMDCSHLGSSLSLRSLARMGSTLSLFGISRLGSSLSVLEITYLGSSMSLRSFSRLGATMSVFDCTHLGSSLSLRSIARVGSSLSLFGMSRLGSSLSVLDLVSLGASLSLRAFSRIGSSMSVFAFSHLGSSLSLRSLARVGSAISLLGMTRFGSSLSVLDFVHLGSSLSLRSFARLGSSMSVFDFAHLGSTLSIRGVARFGGEIQACSKLIFTNSQNYIHEVTEDSVEKVGFYVGNARAMSIANSGGTLHGTWTADVTITTSDRRLKKNIRNLDLTLRQNKINAQGPKSASTDPAPSAPGAAGRPSTASWLLRQLRPVSYNFKQGNEAKYMRFGFIADEIEQVLPQVVRELPNQPVEEENAQGKKEPPKKGVMYTDLIAVLTTVVKDFSFQLKGLQARMKTAEGELERLDEEDPMDDEEDEDESP